MAKKPIAFTRDKVGAGPPRDAPWLWLTVQLLASDAWRFRSVNCVRLIEYLMIEYRSHAGLTNGEMVATYNQLEIWGLSRVLIAKAIAEAEEKGLVIVDRRGRRSMTESYYLRYRLTFYPSRGKDEFAREVWRAATNEWQRWRREKS